MRRISILMGLLFSASFMLFGQHDTATLNQADKQYYQAQLDSMDRLWAVQQLENIPNQPLDYLPYDTIDIKNILTEIEQVLPLDYSPLIPDFLQLYAAQHHQQTERLLGLAEAYLPVMDSILQKHHIPAEFKFLPLVMSAMNPHFRSEKGAYGPWLLTYSTGRLYELEIDSYIDERRDLLLSTEAAANMLSDLYKIYQDWRLVFTAYTCGPSNVNRAIKRAGTHKNLDAVFRHLPKPERYFYAAFEAFLIMYHNQQAYQLSPVNIQWPVKTDTVHIKQKMHLGQVAEVLDLDQSFVRDLNPIYRRSIIPASYQTFTLRLPHNVKDTFLALQDSIVHYRDTFYFDIKPEPNISSGKKYANRKPRSPSGNHTAIYYTIKSGDNLGYISEWFDVSIRDIQYWNNIHSHTIRAGQRLLIYVPKDKADYYREYDNLSFAAKEKREGKPVNVPQQKQASPQETLKEGEYTIYVVKQGDNPWSIAQKYEGVSDQDILRWNNIRPRDLRPGQKLKIKKQ
ncbi:MAG: LysM peptidoglycan-binding domain-containing protein [Bacteroidales bacterium]